MLIDRKDTSPGLRAGCENIKHKPSLSFFLSSFLFTTPSTYLCKPSPDNLERFLLRPVIKLVDRTAARVDAARLRRRRVLDLNDARFTSRQAIRVFDGVDDRKRAQVGVVGVVSRVVPSEQVEVAKHKVSRTRGLIGVRLSVALLRAAKGDAK